MDAVLEDRRHELRERIVEATLRVIRERGIARTSTKAIAAEAGCAEGSIYRYFSGKPDLFREAVRSGLPQVDAALLALPARAGSDSVRENLTAAALAASSFYAELVSLATGAFSDADLLLELRRLLADGGLPADVAAVALADYLEAERRVGRIGPGTDVDTAARLLLRGCLGECFLDALLDRDASLDERRRRVEAFVDLLERELVRR